MLFPADPDMLSNTITLNLRSFSRRLKQSVSRDSLMQDRSTVHRDTRKRPDRDLSPASTQDTMRGLIKPYAARSACHPPKWAEHLRLRNRIIFIRIRRFRRRKRNSLHVFPQRKPLNLTRPKSRRRNPQDLIISERYPNGNRWCSDGTRRTSGFLSMTLSRSVQKNRTVCLRRAPNTASNSVTIRRTAALLNTDSMRDSRHSLSLMQ